MANKASGPAEAPEVIIIDGAGTEHAFPPGFDPKKAAAIVQEQNLKAGLDRGGHPIAGTDLDAQRSKGFHDALKKDTSISGSVAAGGTGFVEGISPRAALSGAVNTLLLPFTIIKNVIGDTVDFATDPLGTIADAKKSIKNMPADVRKAFDDAERLAATDPEAFGKAVGELTSATEGGIAAGGTVAKFRKPIARIGGGALIKAAEHPTATRFAGGAMIGHGVLKDDPTQVVGGLATMVAPAIAKNVGTKLQEYGGAETPGTKLATARGLSGARTVPGSSGATGIGLAPEAEGVASTGTRVPYARPTPGVTSAVTESAFDAETVAQMKKMGMTEDQIAKASARAKSGRVGDVATPTRKGAGAPAPKPELKTEANAPAPSGTVPAAAPAVTDPSIQAAANKVGTTMGGDRSTGDAGRAIADRFGVDTHQIPASAADHLAQASTVNDIAEIEAPKPPAQPRTGNPGIRVGSLGANILRNTEIPADFEAVGESVDPGRAFPPAATVDAQAPSQTPARASSELETEVEVPSEPTFRASSMPKTGNVRVGAPKHTAQGLFDEQVGSMQVVDPESGAVQNNASGESTASEESLRRFRDIKDGGSIVVEQAGRPDVAVISDEDYVQKRDNLQAGQRLVRVDPKTGERVPVDQYQPKPKGKAKGVRVGGTRGKITSTRGADATVDEIIAARDLDGAEEAGTQFAGHPMFKGMGATERTNAIRDLEPGQQAGLLPKGPRADIDKKLKGMTEDEAKAYLAKAPNAAAYNYISSRIRKLFPNVEVVK